MKLLNRVTIPPYSARSVELHKGELLYIIDLEGKQVGDFVCYNMHDYNEHVSPVHMRSSLSSIRLKIGDQLYSNYRRGLMRMEADTVGKHDFFFPACDKYRYQVDFGVENHPNCHDNLLMALQKYPIDREHLPDPINWFMNNAMNEQGDYEIHEPLSKPGDYVCLRALEDVVCACTACSQDFVPVNGMKVTPIELQVTDDRI